MRHRKRQRGSGSLSPLVTLIPLTRKETQVERERERWISSLSFSRSHAGGVRKKGRREEENQLRVCWGDQFLLLLMLLLLTLKRQANEDDERRCERERMRNRANGMLCR